MAFPDIVAELVERFDSNREAYRSDQYNEAQLRQEFINPFFAALGWDMDNKAGYAQAYKDVVHEDSLKISGGTKAPDYCFRIGGARKFFVEAKKPAVNLRDDPSPAFQLRRYAWSAKLPLSILTDFEECAVYDCRVKPASADKAAAARVRYVTYKDYAAQWDEIAAVFSRDAILKGAFDKYAESTSGKRGTAEVDDAFLRDIESWRDSLAHNLALRNPGLSQRELNFAVQRTIDRIIFLRICEDRGIESYAGLRVLLNGARVYPRLTEMFRAADDRYNSGLFHFGAEKGRPETPDELTLSLAIDDKPLKDIIRNLYYPDSPYEFSVLPADILGQVYEQFLGKVIRLTPGHQAKVEDKPEVKKAGGVYYTPTYIVDYIVANTVGKLVEGKTPKQVEKLRILDPACGSGSFLIGAYQYLLDWHRDWYVADNPQKWARGSSARIYDAGGSDWRLINGERKRILLNNIYGVDIDSQAVEVTKLSLLLKIIEGGAQLALAGARMLPDLGGNIKCGNSLIGPDFYAGQQMTLLDEEERYRVNVFDWNAEFSEVMKAGGFDAVIGNPPYVRPHNIPDQTKQALWKYFDTFVAKSDMYSCFMEKGLQLVKVGGLFGFIVPHTWTSLESFTKIRQHVLQHARVRRLVHLPKKVFQTATVETCIFVFERVPATSNKSANRVLVERLEVNGSASPIREFKQGDIEDAYLCNFQLHVSDGGRRIADRLGMTGLPLAGFVSLVYGFKTADDEKFIHDSSLYPESRPFVRSGSIRRYRHDDPREYVWYVPGMMTANARTARPGEARRFEAEKIIVARMGKALVACYDPGGLYVKDAMLLLHRDGAPSLKYLLGILNSSPLNYFYRAFFVTIDVLKNALLSLPIRPINFSDPADKARHDRMVGLVDQMLSLHKQLAEARLDDQKTAIQRQIDFTDRQIDLLVYELYGLGESEIAIVESAQV